MPLHVLALQPSLPKYRVPVFRELSSRAGIDLRVGYSQVAEIPNATPDGFIACQANHRDLWFKQYSLVWQGAPKEYFRPDWCDCVIMNWNTRYLSMIPTMLEARSMQIPVVLWGHGFSKQESRLRRWIRVQSAKLADAIVTYNHAAADSLVREGIPRQRVFVALNSLDQGPIRAARSAWMANPERLATFRREQGIDAGPMLLFCSRLDPANRVDLLLEAVARLRASHPGLNATIIGSGPHEAELRRIIERRGLQTCVKMLGAIYEEDKLAPWFMSARAFVYPANIGLSLLHAQGYGLPVVTGDRVDMQNPEIEAMVHERNGLTFRHESLDALVAAVDRILSDDALHDRLAAESLATVTRQFTIPRMVDGLEAAIRYTTRLKLASPAALAR